MSGSATTGSKTGATAARGVLAEQGSGQIVLALPGTDYRLQLRVSGAVTATPTGRIAGRIEASARRVDLTKDSRGGRYIEPVYGRPRRVQGRITAVDPDHNQITVLAACPVNCRLMANQQASQFQVGQFVTFDVEPGATFTPLPNQPT